MIVFCESQQYKEEIDQNSRPPDVGQRNFLPDQSDKKAKLQFASRILVTKILEGFLTNKGQAENYEGFFECVGLKETEFKKFLDYMALSGKYPYINPLKDPRDNRYKGERNTVFSVIDYCVEHTVFIWNIDHTEYE